MSWPAATAPSTHVLTVRNVDRLELWEYDLDASPIKLQKRRILLPNGARTLEVEGSPDGKQIAYLVEESTVPMLTRLLGRFWPGSQEAVNTISLWVSRTDGSQLRRIGYQRSKSAAGVQWAPDGKRLSLFLDNGFYIVPVE